MRHFLIELVLVPANPTWLNKANFGATIAVNVIAVIALLRRVTLCQSDRGIVALEQAIPALLVALADKGTKPLELDLLAAFTAPVAAKVVSIIADFTGVGLVVTASLGARRGHIGLINSASPAKEGLAY